MVIGFKGVTVASLPVLGQPLVGEVVQRDVRHPDLLGGHADHVHPAVLTWRPRHVHVAPRERAHGPDGQHLADAMEECTRIDQNPSFGFFMGIRLCCLGSPSAS